MFPMSSDFRVPLLCAGLCRWFAKGKTVLMIAHRLSTVANADCIYVVRDGQIAESGTKDELCAQNGLFARMWQEYQASVQWKVAKEG